MKEGRTRSMCSLVVFLLNDNPNSTVWLVGWKLSALLIKLNSFKLIPNNNGLHANLNLPPNNPTPKDRYIDIDIDIDIERE